MNSEKKSPLLGLSCREASRLISDSLDRELTRRERWSLRLHTLLCIACRRFEQQIRMIRDTIASALHSEREAWSEDATKLSAERRTRISRLLNEARQRESRD